MGQDEDEHGHEGTFAGGQEREEHHPEHERRGDFAEGAEEESEHMHEGSFAEGQEREEHHPETGRHGEYAEGQERD
jgi:hypothetical protein